MSQKIRSILLLMTIALTPVGAYVAWQAASACPCGDSCPCGEACPCGSH